jgi:hypothetical protein
MTTPISSGTRANDIEQSTPATPLRRTEGSERGSSAYSKLGRVVAGYIRSRRARISDFSTAIAWESLMVPGGTKAFNTISPNNAIVPRLLS